MAQRDVVPRMSGMLAATASVFQTIMTDRSRPWSLSHYRVISKLGAGGMGEVYLAEDTRLNRKVAIKLLPADGDPQ